MTTTPPSTTPPPASGEETPDGDGEAAPRGRGRYTIRDIARLAEVSRSTVSLAINDSPKINKDTKAKVLEVIERVGYRPNQTARNLVRQRSNTLLVILPPIGHVFADSYFSESLSGILDGVTDRHLHLMVELATEEFKRDNQARKLYEQGSIDGVLCVGALTTDTYLEDLHAGGCPVVLVNSTLAGVPNVLAGNSAAAMRAVKHLASLGHKRIAHIKGSDQVTSAIDRTLGYRRGIEEVGLDFSEDLIAQGFFGRRSGAQAMSKLLALDPRPTAVFVSNDMMAIGAIQAIKEAGLRVPEDIAIFGADDVQLAPYIRPPLSTLRQDMYAMGQAALDHLGKYLDEDKIYNSTVPINVRLVIRESCGASMQAAEGKWLPAGDE